MGFLARYLSNLVSRRTLRSPPSIAELSQTNNFEEECIRYLIHLRWPEVLACLRCGSSRTFEFDRQAREGRVRHLYECLNCRYQFSPTTGTIFHNSHLSLTKWFLAIERICSADRRVAAKQLQRELRVTYETAWNVLRRIRQTMLKDEEFRQKFSGIGEIWRPIGEAEPDKPLNRLLRLPMAVALPGSPLRAARSQK